MNNPFVVGRYVSSEYFCDRVEETQTLIKHIENGRDVALISPRRLGKTGLIEHTFHQPEISENFSTFYIDIYGTRSFQEFIFLFGKGILSQLKPTDVGLKERFLRIVKSLQIGVGFDSVTATPVFDLKLGAVTSPQTTLDEIFSYIDQADKPCVIAFDEFQQIANYADGENVEALLRTKIQQCSNARFIFSGSKHHLMSNMFLSPVKPFYQSALIMGLGPIDVESYKAFAEQKFVQYGKRVEPALVEQVYRLFDGTSWYVQMMMNELFAITDKGQTCGSDLFQTAFDNIIQAQAYAYHELMDRIPTKQKSALIAVAKEGRATSVTSGAFIKKHQLPSSSSVQSALRALTEADIVTQENGTYRIYDYFLSAWVRDRY